MLKGRQGVCPLPAHRLPGSKGGSLGRGVRGLSSQAGPCEGQGRGGRVLTAERAGGEAWAAERPAQPWVPSQAAQI